VISDSGTGSAQLGEIAQVETAYNPVTCQSQVETMQVSTAPAAGGAGGGTTGVASGSSAEPSNTPSSAATVQYQLAHMKTSWIDPLTITITSLTANLKWPLYGSCATSYGRNNSYEFAWDGWSNTGVPPVRITSNCSTWTSSGSETFTNVDFEQYLLAGLRPSPTRRCLAAGRVGNR